MSNFEAGLSLINYKLSIFPVHGIVDGKCTCGDSGCGSAGKHPCVKNWQALATTDKEQIQSWAERFPDCNWGVVTGRQNNLVVIDVDPRNGGVQSLQVLEAKHGMLPKTWKVNSGGSGEHYYFWLHGASLKGGSNKLGMGIDLKADGGFVVAPSSLHKSGNLYKWAVGQGPNNLERADAPDFLFEDESTAEKTVRTKFSLPKPVLTADSRFDEGSRNQALTSIAGLFRRLGLSQQELGHVLWLVNVKQCDPPLAASEVAKIAESISKYPPAAINSTYYLTEGGNGERFVDSFGDDMKFAKSHGWLCWNRSHWARENGEMARAAKKIIAQLHDEAEAAAMVADATGMDAHEKKAKASASHAKASDKANGIKGILEWAETEGKIRITADALDRDKWLLNVENGTIDLKTGKIHEHDKADLITRVAPVTHDKSAQCPRWLAFIDRITGGDKDLAWYLQKLVGYSLTGRTDEQAFFILFGQGSNGKSVFVETIFSLLGEYAAETQAETLMVTKGFGSSHNEPIARLAARRLVSANETEEGQRLAEGRIKGMTGGDRLVARFPYAKESFEFMPEFKLLIRTNNRPIIRGVDHGIWRRVHLIPFNQMISEAEKDPALKDKLLAELPGILNWAIDGCLGWQQEGLKHAKAVADASNAYRRDMDTIGLFLEHKALATPIGAQDLYRDYETWCKDNGEDPLNQTLFGNRLNNLGYEKEKNSKGCIVRYPPNYRKGRAGSSAA